VGRQTARSTWSTSGPVDALRNEIDDDVELIETETDVNDEAFAEAIAETLDSYMREAGIGPVE